MSDLSINKGRHFAYWNHENLWASHGDVPVRATQRQDILHPGVPSRVQWGAHNRFHRSASDLPGNWAPKLTGAFYVGLLDGLLGVAGMMALLVIMDHSRKFPTKHQ